MSATIFRQEFRTHIRSVIVWSLSIAALTFFFFNLFGVFANQAALVDEFMAKYPPALRAAFGMDNMALSTVPGFFSFLFMFVQLCLAIQASNYGFGLVSIEENELTADFLLSKPVSRSQVLVSKFLAAFAALTITSLVTWGCSFLFIEMFRDGRAYDAGKLSLVLFSISLFQLFFLGVGLVISLLVKRVRSVTPYALGLGFGTYVLNGFSGIFGDVALEYLTPFKHLDAAYILTHGAFNTPLLLVNLAVTLAALAISYVLYLRRDIPAVS